MDNQKDRYKLEHYIVALVLMLLLTASILIPISSNQRSEKVVDNLREFYKADASSLLTQNEDPFENLNLKAKSAFVWDIKNQQVIFEMEADEVRPLASISKILLAAVSLDILSPDTQITIEPDFLEAEGDSGLLFGETWSFEELLEFSLLVSSNDGARAIASVAGSRSLHSVDYEVGREEFVRLMNKKARALGMSSIDIKNETGLDLEEDESISGAYGTAREVALLFEVLVEKYPEILESTKQSQAVFTSLNNVLHDASNTNQIAYSIPGLTASKTGYTDLAGGNLAVVFDPSIGHPMVAVVLGSTFEERFSDIQKLVEASSKYLINRKKLMESISGVSSIQIKNSD